MKLQKKYRLISLAFISICVFIPQVQAGLWDDIKNKTKNVTERVINETVDEVVGSEPDETTAEPKYSPQKPQYDKQLVIDTQGQLNRLGYNVGAVDGLYGNGTRRAIERFQKDQKLPVDGQPSATLLSRMKSSSPSQQVVAQDNHKIDTVAPQSSSAPVKIRHDFDIVGLKLGMTPDQVAKALKAHNNNVQIEYIRFEHKTIPEHYAQHIAHLKTPDLPEHLQMIFATVNGNAERITIEFAEPPSSSVVRRIERMNKFDRNTMPSTENVTSALKNKYGTPTDTEEWVVAWNYSTSSDANRQKYCASQVKGAAKENVKRSVPANCGLALTAHLGRAGDGIVGWMQTVLVDYQELERQKLATNDLRTQMVNERSQQKQRSAGQNSAPKL